MSVRAGMTLGVVGESGSGKSVTLRALCGLVPHPGRVTGGRLAVNGQPWAWDNLEALRGSFVSMIFQDPSSSLTPVRTVGSQLEEVLRVKVGLGRQAARKECVELLGHVGIPEPSRRARAYPHELSGGLRQRVAIAMAIATRPRLLLADEPTTALDVTTQEQILVLLKRLQREERMAMVFVTHDMGVVHDIADDVAVMYAGYIVERGTAGDITGSPRHPYTIGLLAAVPKLRTRVLVAPIPGQPPNMAALPLGCPFAPRCAEARPECKVIDMALEAHHPSACACPFNRQARLTTAPAT
jgi:oligopeptide/dipeptide ABC transporter ATP-binding protein